jgi:hypothetical protein
MAGEFLSRRAAIDVLSGLLDEVLLTEPAVGFST